MTPSELESTTRELLRLAGMHVSPETLLGFKKVDTYAEERRMNKLHRIAVECKRYTDRITQAQLAAIVANYQPLYESNLIDEILLVSMNGLTASAEGMVRASRIVHHMTIAELESSVIDFAGYLAYLIDELRTDSLNDYYITPMMTGGESLEDYVENWVATGRRPIAVIAGYGMGKTSFVRHYAAHLAERAQEDPAARVPIVVKLTDISAEQSVEGLISRTLATRHLVRNYTFESFMALNRRGRFVIFLDGFDEMKHTLTWNEFRFNMTELNKLVDGDSRVLLLGRPNAFLSDDEHRYVLHGVRRVNDDFVRDPTSPDFVEVSLRSFTSVQVTEFLRRYTEVLRILEQNREEGTAERTIYDADAIAAKIKRLPADRLYDLASRPVQLKILAEVLPQWKDTFPLSLTVAKMYSAFIDLVIDREQRKLTRGEFTNMERRNFARALAYWLWSSSGAMNVAAEDIPDHLLPARLDTDLDGIRRDMVSACFLERKVGDRLYFPHRSFQEFLVAETVLNEVRSASLTTETAFAVTEMVSKAVTADVASFLGEMVIGADALKFDWLLNSYRGPVSITALIPWLIDEEIVRLEGRILRGQTEPWDVIMYAVAGYIGKVPATHVALRLKEGLPALPQRDHLAAFVSLCWLAGHLPAQPESVAALWDALSASHPLVTEFGGSLNDSVLARVHVVLPREGAGGLPRIEFGMAADHACEQMKTGTVIAEWSTKHLTRGVSLPAFLAPPSRDGFSGSFQELLFWVQFGSRADGLR